MSTKLTFLGHSGFLVSGATHTVAIDPFLTDNPVASHAPEDIRCNAIALTHGHADHFGDTIAIATANNASVFAAYEICNYCGEHGIEAVEPMNPGGKVNTDFGYIALTMAVHSSSYENRYMGMACGVIVEMDGVTIYHLGDTAIFGDMKLIGEIYKPDIAIVPIGDRFTMGPDTASLATEMINPKVAIPVHYDTWPGIEQDPGDFQPRGVEVKVMASGEEWAYQGVLSS